MENKQTKLTKLLNGLGVPSNWAKVIAGAIVGAVTAAMALQQTSCTSIDVTQDKAVLEGERGRLEVDQGRLSWTQNQPQTAVQNIKPVK